MGNQQRRAENRHDGADDLGQAGQLPLRDGKPCQDEDRHQVLDDGGSRGVAAFDGNEVGVLHGHHAQHAEGQQPVAAFPVLPDGEDVVFVDEGIDGQQQDTCRNGADSRQVICGHALFLQDKLGGYP